MKTANQIAQELAEPFPPSHVHFRVGATNQAKDSGIALAFLDSRHVMQRLDDVVGPENWQCRYPFIGCCDIGIKIEGEWVWKANGAGETQVEAEKGQYSDAFKRAGAVWGVGRYLYYAPNKWYQIQNRRFTNAALTQMQKDLEAFTSKFSARLKQRYGNEDNK